MQEQTQSPRQQKQSQQSQQSYPLKQSKHRYQSFNKLLLIIINISLSSSYFGYTIIYMSVIQFETTMKIYQINMEKSKMEGFLAFCVAFGGLVGSFLSSYFINNVSRKNSILYINYLAIVVGLLVFVTDIKVFVVVRIFQGICAGLYSALVSLLIKQTAPFELSGFFGVFHQLFITIGIFTSCILSFVLSQIYSDPSGLSYWKIIFGLPLVIIIFQTLTIHFMYPYQTPKYLVMKNDELQAKKVLSIIYLPEHIDQVLQQYKSNLTNHSQKQLHSQDDNTNKNQKKQLKITKIVSLHLALLQQFVGISAVSNYAGLIAQGNLGTLKPILPSILNFEQVVSAIISSCLLTKYGRKTILQFGTIGAMVTTFIISVGFFINSLSPSFSEFLILIGLFCFMANFGLSLGPIVWMYIPQIVQANFLPYSTMLNWGGSALCLLLFPIIKSNLPNENPAPLFLFFSLWSLCAYFINRRFVVQTKGKTSSQIQQQFKNIESKYKQ